MIAGVDQSIRPQHQEAAVEPGREQVDEILVDRGEVVAMVHRIEQLLAHAHQRGGAAGRQIEPAQQLLPARLGRAMDLGRGGIGGRALPGRDRGIRAAARSGPKRSPAPRRRRCADRLSARRSAREFRAPAPRRRPRRGRTATPRTDRPGWRSAARRPRAGRARSISARPRSAMVCSSSPKNEVFTGSESVAASPIR